MTENINTTNYIRENENWNLDNGESVVKAIDMISTKQLIHLNIL